MPPTDESEPSRSLQDVIDDIGLYPPEAFDFVQQGLTYTVQKLHGDEKDPEASRHVSGQQLCEGLREYALMQWGFLASVVLKRWNIQSTIDFGRIVFALVDNGFMQKTERDTIEDFRNVFSFDGAFESGYRIKI
ncbi:MAG TPA: Minf_1886 family protein [Tepidisphaeraceae bacterium]|jgi:uncharacterized repeat protein (TIGR04138 family)|nr:Minf_1886 family protein [Tepidisphaeraceae bacterium]